MINAPAHSRHGSSSAVERVQAPRKGSRYDGVGGANGIHVGMTSGIIGGIDRMYATRTTLTLRATNTGSDRIGVFEDPHRLHAEVRIPDIRCPNASCYWSVRYVTQSSRRMNTRKTAANEIAIA